MSSYIENNEKKNKTLVNYSEPSFNWNDMWGMWMAVVATDVDNSTLYKKLFHCHRAHLMQIFIHMYNFRNRKNSTRFYDFFKRFFTQNFKRFYANFNAVFFDFNKFQKLLQHFSLISWDWLQL